MDDEVQVISELVISAMDVDSVEEKEKKNFESQINHRESLIKKPDK